MRTRCKQLLVFSQVLPSANHRYSMHVFMSLRSSVFARKCTPSERTVPLSQAHGINSALCFGCCLAHVCGRLVNRNMKSQTEQGTLTEEGQRIVLRAAFERQSRHLCVEIGAVHGVITMVAIEQLWPSGCGARAHGEPRH